MTDLQSEILGYGQRARAAARILARTGTEQKNTALRAMAGELCGKSEPILAANRADVERAQTDGLSPAMIDRLSLTPKRVEAMAEGIRQVARSKTRPGKSSPNGRGQTACAFPKSACPSASSASSTSRART